MATKKKKPAITVEEQVLVETGFTEQGKNVFSKRMKGLSDELFDKSVSIAETYNSANPEITGENVNKAYHILLGNGIESHKTLRLVMEFLTLISSIGIGIGASNTTTIWGLVVLAFFSLVSIGVMVFRLYLDNNK